MTRLRHLAAAGALTLAAQAASADLIDFESGFADLQVAGTVVTATNAVTFSVDSMSDANAYIAERGSPTTGFVPLDAASGNFSLSDDPGAPFGADDYVLEFLNPISDLSLEIYDVRGDGGGSVGDIVTLSVFSDVARTNLIASDSFVVAAGLADGLAQTLSVSGIAFGRAATVSYGNDNGTALDNISFTTAAVPAPATLLLLGMGLLAIGWRRTPA